MEELIDLELLYGHNHNTDIVGKTWKKHYELFYEFIFTESFANKNPETNTTGKSVSRGINATFAPARMP